MSVGNSVISGNANHASASRGWFGAAGVIVDNCRIVSNATGISQTAGGTIRIGNPAIAFNRANGTSGTVSPFGNNRTMGNAGTTTLTPVGADTHDKGQQ